MNNHNYPVSKYTVMASVVPMRKDSLAFLIATLYVRVPTN
jgi:hypothetical protein